MFLNRNKKYNIDEFTSDSCIIRRSVYNMYMYELRSVHDIETKKTKYVKKTPPPRSVQCIRLRMIYFIPYTMRCRSVYNNMTYIGVYVYTHVGL